MSNKKTYTLEEMDAIILEHIDNEADVLRKNLEKKSTKDIEYV